MWKIVATSALCIVASGCGEDTFECQKDPPPRGGILVLAVDPNVTEREEALFKAAAMHWWEWTGARVTLDRSLPINTVAIVLKRVEAQAEVDEVLSNLGPRTMAFEHRHSIHFLPSKMTSEHDLEMSFTHEIGHILGLGHVSDDEAVMFWAPNELPIKPTAVEQRAIEQCYVARRDRGPTRPGH